MKSVCFKGEQICTQKEVKMTFSLWAMRCSNGKPRVGISEDRKGL